MEKREWNIEPQSLNEKLAARGDVCPIPYTHDRIHETHHWWHEMARYYHEPQQFRYALGAFLQAARSVTFMLQKEQGIFKDFSWYHTWVEQAKKDPALQWLHDARTDYVHRQALEPHSWLSMRCIDNPRQYLSDEDDDGSLAFDVSPFECTHYYMNHDIVTDHGHEWTRHWEIDGLEGCELLEVCADIYDRLDALVVDAHRRLGSDIGTSRSPHSKRALPCMEDPAKHRIVRTFIRDGQEVWQDEPPQLHRE
jgi:hypothetical protein